MKHPIILDGNSIFVKLLVSKHHEKAFDQELDTVINELKGTYYIFNHKVVKKQWRQSQQLVGVFWRRWVKKIPANFT
jgi:hypothetical protein